MSHKFAIVLVAWLVALPPVQVAADQSRAPATQDQAAPAAPATSLADVEFMAGSWKNDENGNLSEEVWTLPYGDSMQGMWRYVTGGKVKLFEALTLTQEASGVVMRLRHFDPAMGAKEDKPYTLRLVADGPNRAQFEGPGSTGTLRITYERNGDILNSTVESGGRREEYRFQRIK